MIYASRWLALKNKAHNKSTQHNIGGTIHMHSSHPHFPINFLQALLILICEKPFQHFLFHEEDCKTARNMKAPESHQLFNLHLHLEHRLCFCLFTFSPEQYGALIMHLLSSKSAQWSGRLSQALRVRMSAVLVPDCAWINCKFMLYVAVFIISFPSACMLRARSACCKRLNINLQLKSGQQTRG